MQNDTAEGHSVPAIKQKIRQHENYRDQEVETLLDAVETLMGTAEAKRLPDEDRQDLKQDALLVGWRCLNKYDKDVGDLGIYVWTSIKHLPKRRNQHDFSVSRRDNTDIKRVRYLYPDDLKAQREAWVEDLKHDGADFDNLHKQRQEMSGQGSLDGFEFGSVEGDHEAQERIDDRAAITQVFETSHLWEQELNERQREVAALYISGGDYSNRDIARMVGCDHKTVGTDIKFIVDCIRYFGFGIGTL